MITNILFVAFSGLYARKDFTRIQQLSHNAEKYISILVLPLAVFTIIFAEPILMIFGDDTGPSVPILQIIVIAIDINATLNPYSVQVISTGHIRLGFKLGILTLSMNLILNLISIPDELAGISLFGLGAKGAAFATLISFVVRGILAKYFAFKITGTRPNARIFLHILAGGITFICVWIPIPFSHSNGYS